MKTKTYLFTELEIIAIRDALIENKQRLKKLKPKSRNAVNYKIATTNLAEQFKTDARNI